MQFIDLNTQQKQIREKIDNQIKKILDHGKYIMGPEVHELEDRLANYVNVKHCISCSSGTDALLIPLMETEDRRCSNYFTFYLYSNSGSYISCWSNTRFCDIYDKTFNKCRRITKSIRFGYIKES